jgi:RNA polymerase sigma factor (sigma-70 family)
VTRSLDSYSDGELVDLARNGRDDAFAELWRRHADAGRRYARALSWSADSEDIVSESFARIFQLIKRGKGPTNGFRAYLATTIRHTSQHLGQSQREIPIDFADDLADERTDDDHELRDLDRSVTMDAFRTLPKRWQEALWYSEVEDLSVAECAKIFGIKPTAMAMLTFRAREGLREAWIQAHISEVPDGSEHQWTIGRLGSYARNNLPRVQRERVEAHLEICERCSIVAEEARYVGSRLAIALLGPIIGVGAAGAYLSVGTGKAAAAELAPAGGGATAVAPAPVATRRVRVRPRVSTASAVTAGTAITVAAAAGAAIAMAVALNHSAPVDPSVRDAAGTPAATVSPGPHTTGPDATATPPAGPQPTAGPAPTAGPHPPAGSTPTVGPTATAGPGATVSPPTHTPVAPRPEQTLSAVADTGGDHLFFPRLSGVAAPGASVRILQGGMLVAATTAGRNGRWFTRQLVMVEKGSLTVVSGADEASANRIEIDVTLVEPALTATRGPSGVVVAVAGVQGAPFALEADGRAIAAAELDEAGRWIRTFPEGAFDPSSLEVRYRAGDRYGPSAKP